MPEHTSGKAEAGERSRETGEKSRPAGDVQRRERPPRETGEALGRPARPGPPPGPRAVFTSITPARSAAPPVSEPTFGARTPLRGSHPYISAHFIFALRLARIACANIFFLMCVYIPETPTASPVASGNVVRKNILQGS